jgi:hypothetical protein
MKPLTLAFLLLALMPWSSRAAQSFTPLLVVDSLNTLLARPPVLNESITVLGTTNAFDVSPRIAKNYPNGSFAADGVTNFAAVGGTVWHLVPFFSATGSLQPYSTNLDTLAGLIGGNSSNFFAGTGAFTQVTTNMVPGLNAMLATLAAGGGFHVNAQSVTNLYEPTESGTHLTNQIGWRVVGSQASGYIKDNSLLQGPTLRSSKIYIPSQGAGFNGEYDAGANGTNIHLLYYEDSIGWTNIVESVDINALVTKSGIAKTSNVQPTNAALTALSSNPSLYQATNSSLTAIASNPSLYQATNASLTALSANPSLYQATNATLTLLSANDGSSLTSTGATNNNQLITLSQLQASTANGEVYYFTTNAAAGLIPGGTVKSTNWASVAVPPLGTNIAVTSVTGDYVAKYISTNSFASVSSGLLDVDVYAFEGAAGSGQIAAEAYVVNTVTGIEDFEFGLGTVPQTVAAGTTPTLLTFSIPITDYTSTTNFYIAVKLKVTVTGGANVTVRIVSGGTYSSHMSFAVPNSNFVKKTGDTMTGTLAVPTVTLNGSDLATTLTNKMAASAALTNLANGSGAGLTNVAMRGLGQPEVSGVVLDGATASTKVMSLCQNIGTNDYSIWVRTKIPTAASSMYIVSLTDVFSSSDHAGSVSISLDASGNLLAVTSASVGNYRIKTYPSIVGSYGGKITDLNFTRAGTNVLLYVNGVLTPQTGSDTVAGSAPFFDTALTSTYLRVGSGTDTTLVYNQPIYRTAIFNRALSQADVTSLINNGIDPADQWGTQTQVIGFTAPSYLNGGFETNSLNAANTWATTVAGSSAITIDTSGTLSHSGANAAKIAIDNADSTAVITANNSGNVVAANARYRASIWARKDTTTSGSPILKAEAPSGTTVLTTAALTTTYVQTSAEFTSAAAGIFRVLKSSGTTSSTNYVDDVELTRIGAILDLDFTQGYGSIVPDRSSNLLVATNYGGVSYTLPNNLVFPQTWYYTNAQTATWTNPPGAKLIEVHAWGGGGGGGSGRRGLTNTVRTGGAGGGAGAYSFTILQASDVASTVIVTNGAGGAGGAAQSSASANGNAGANGVRSSFGTYCTADYGQGGSAGNTTTTAGGATLFSFYTIFPPAGGDASATGGNAPVAPDGSPYYRVYPGSGGGGGGNDVANVAGTGAGGGAGVRTINPIPLRGVGGATAGATGGNGVAAGRIIGGGPGGGGGAGGGNSAAGGDGGNGGTAGAGGGGGGAGTDATGVTGGASGKGGNGADGMVIIIAR